MGLSLKKPLEEIETLEERIAQREAFNAEKKRKREEVQEKRKQKELEKKAE